MKRRGDVFGRSRKLLLSAAGLVAVAVSIAFGLTTATSSLAQSPVQNPAPTAPAYEFDVATINLSQDKGLGGVLGFLSEDSFRARNMTLKSVIRDAYGLWGGREEMVLGGPKWLDTDRYYVIAKMDATVADKLKKLSPDQRKLTQDQMVRALLADRLKLQTHRETKEFPVYALNIAKNGPNLHEAKPGDPYTNAFAYADKFAGGGAKAGDIFLVGGGGPEGNTMTIYGFGVSMPALAKQLTIMAGQTVQDKTGLTGTYDFTLKYWMTPMRRPSEGAPDGQLAIDAPDPSGGPSLFTAIQKQLGLKLESGKGPVEIVVIDHVERPSGN